MTLQERLVSGSPAEAAEAIWQLWNQHAHATSPLARLRTEGVESALERLRTLEPKSRLRWYLLMLWRSADDSETAQRLLDALRRDSGLLCELREPYLPDSLELWIWAHLPPPLYRAVEALWQAAGGLSPTALTSAIKSPNDLQAILPALARYWDNLEDACTVARFLLSRRFEPYASEWAERAVTLLRQTPNPSEAYHLLTALIDAQQYALAAQIVDIAAQYEQACASTLEYARVCIAHAQGDIEAMERALAQLLALSQGAIYRAPIEAARALTRIGRLHEALQLAAQAHGSRVVSRLRTEIARELCALHAPETHWSQLQAQVAHDRRNQLWILDTILRAGDADAALRWLKACSLEPEGYHRTLLACVLIKAGKLEQGETYLDCVDTEGFCWSGGEVARALIEAGASERARNLLQRCWEWLCQQPLRSQTRLDYTHEYASLWLQLNEIAIAQAVLEEGMALADAPNTVALEELCKDVLFQLVEAGHLDAAYRGLTLLPDTKQPDLLLDIAKAHYQRGEIALAQERLRQFVEMTQSDSRRESPTAQLTKLLDGALLARQHGDQHTTEAILALARSIVDSEPSVLEHNAGLNHLLLSEDYQRAYDVWQRLGKHFPACVVDAVALGRTLVAVLGELGAVSQLVDETLRLAREKMFDFIPDAWHTLSDAGRQAYLEQVMQQLPDDEHTRGLVLKSLAESVKFWATEDMPFWEQVAQQLLQLIQRLPATKEYYEARIYLARALLCAGMRAHAAELVFPVPEGVEPFTRINAAEVLALAGRFEQVEMIASRLSPELRVDVYASVADFLTDNGDYAGATRWAQRALEQALQQDPDTCLRFAGLALNNLHGHEGITCIERLLAWIPHCLQSLARARLATLHAELSEPDRALALALELPPDETHLLYRVGEALLKAGYLRHVRALLPRLCETSTGILSALKLLALAHPESAAEVLQMVREGA
ncbi:MAG: hypothetical protein NZ874_04455 [Fimbriimonadales bacterium]|nr:hypothetical protein [Fimbriimonadales bacterium]